MGSGGNVQIVQGEAILARHADWVRGEADLVEHSVKDVARPVAGEHTPGPVGTVCARRESKNQDAGGRIPKRRHGAAPISLIAIGASLELRDFYRMAAQTRAAPAGYDLLVKDFEQKVTLLLE